MTYKTTAQRREDALLDFRNEAIDRANTAEARVLVLTDERDEARRSLLVLQAAVRASKDFRAAQVAVTHGTEGDAA